jgi:isoquinoline 1-oxidoreductase beta subunit
MLQLNRREVLKAGAAFVIAFRVPTAAAAPGSYQPNAWIRITPDNRITVLSEVPEMGQGPRTTDIMLLAEELDADWATIRVEQAPVIPGTFQHLKTGGSGATREAWNYMRRAGAQARETLLKAAAQEWSVNIADCRTEHGAVVHISSGRRRTYGELVGTASQIPPVDPAKVTLKDAAQFRIVGTATPRTDTPSKVDGSAMFGLDVRVPGMQYAVIARCPHFGGKLASFDATATKAVPGVTAVFAVPPIGFTSELGWNINIAGGVAVVATSTWAAIQGRKALKTVWDKGPGGIESTASLHELMIRQSAAEPTAIAAEQGNAPGVRSATAQRVDATYELPFQAHATMEPMNATVDVRPDGTEVWSSTQIGADCQSVIARLAHVPPEKVTVHMMLCGGSFGRRYQWDYLAEAWQVAKEVRSPVQLVWTREDDIQHGFYRPHSYHKLSAALDGKGGIAAWSHRIVSTPIRSVFDSTEKLKDPKHVASQELDGADDLPYVVPNYRADYAPADSVVPRAWWRSVAASFNAFAIECFVDELAHKAGSDPLEFRLKLLRPGKEKLGAVLRLAAEKSGWGSPMPKSQGRGVACYAGFGSYIAHVAEVSVSDSGAVRVKRIVSAVDCGTAVNPDGVRAMLEGAVNFALTPVLSGEITFQEGAVKQSNFHDYRVLRINDAPDIEVHLVPSTLPPEGMGEPGVPPLAPAVANAVFAATGKRIRRLPIGS